MKRRNFAVIGRNFVVDTFLEAAAERDDVHLLGVYSRLESTARAFAEKHGAEKIGSRSASTVFRFIPTYWVREWFAILQEKVLK